MMDKNGSGIITKSNLDMSKVPPHIKRIFERIVKELRKGEKNVKNDNSKRISQLKKNCILKI